MAEIISNQFTATINKVLGEQPSTNTYEIRSNRFTTTINRVPGGGGADGGASVTEQTAYNTQVIMYKGKQMLTPVSNAPSSGQYQVTIINTVNCEAQLERDHKTITVLRTTGNSGRIDISINVENVKTYTKSISVVTVVSTDTIKKAYTQYKQLSDKFTWLVKSGDSQSTMVLTDKMYELISKNINLTADRINLNGYVSNDDANWSIDNEGNIHAENLKVDGDISADTLTVNYIDNPCYPATLAGSVELLVNANTGNDDYTIDDILQSYDEAEEQNDDSLKKRYKTLQGALDASPAFLNNKNLRITLETNTTEDIYIRGFASGAVRIYLAGHTIYGNVKGYACSATVTIYGGTIDDNTGLQGVIHPNMGLSMVSRCVSVGFEACQYVALYKLKIFGADNKPSDISSDYKVAVVSSAGTGNVYCSDVQVTNCAIGFRTNSMGCLHSAKSSGVASRYGFESVTGGKISLANATQTGGTTGNTSKSSGGQVWYDKPTFTTGNSSNDTTTAPTLSTTKTITIKSTYGDTYRSTVYNNWKKDGSVRQGDYGYGDCTGLWFFGTAFSELKGKTITKVTITITRGRGGSSNAVGLAVKTHKYSARPSGAPTLGTSCGTLSLAAGSTGRLTITNDTVLNGISAGTVKGFGIRTTYDSAHYAVCSGSVTVKITYKE